MNFSGVALSLSLLLSPAVVLETIKYLFDGGTLYKDESCIPTVMSIIMASKALKSLIFVKWYRRKFMCPGGATDVRFPKIIGLLNLRNGLKISSAWCCVAQGLCLSY